MLRYIIAASPHRRIAASPQMGGRMLHRSGTFTTLIPAVVLALAQNCFAGPPVVSSYEEDPWWRWALAAASVVLFPTTANPPEAELTRVTLRENIGGKMDERTVMVPPGGIVQHELSVINGQIIKKVTIESVHVETTGFGFVPPGSSIAGSASIEVSSPHVAQEPFDEVRVDIFNPSPLAIGVGDVVMSPGHTAFSSFGMRVDLLLPDYGLNFPIFTGSASIGQTSALDPTFTAAGDWASCFSTAKGPGVNGRTGTFASCSSLGFSKTFDLPATLPAGTKLLLDVEVTAAGVAAVPEPATALLLAAGIAGVLGWSRRAGSSLRAKAV